MTDLLVVGWERRRVTALEVSGSGANPHVVRSWSQPIPETLTLTNNPQGFGQWLKEQWGAAKLSAKSIFVVLPREDIILRHLELPQAPDDELPDLVRFQAAARSSMPLDQSALDFLPLSPHPARPGRDVLSATVTKAVVEAIRTALSVADRDLIGLTFSSQALGEWAAHLDKDRHRSSTRGGDRATLVLTWDHPRVELAILLDKQLVFAHSARLSLDEITDPTALLLAEVSRTIVAGQRLRPELHVDHAWVVGGSATVAAGLQERLECTAEVIDPFAQRSDRDRAGPIVTQPAEAAVLLGGAMTRMSALTPTLNFIKPRVAPPRRDPRKFRMAVGSAVALAVLFLVGGTTMARLSSFDAMIANMESRISDLNSEVNAGQPPLLGANAISDWTKRDIQQLDLIRDLETKMPGDQERPYLTDYVFTVGTGDALGVLKATGGARQREDVEAMNQQLNDDSRFRLKPTEIVFDDSKDPKYAHRFSLNADMLPPKAEPPAKPKN